MDCSVTDAIIDKIKRNRISSTQIADCLNKTGALPNVLPVNKLHFAVGRVSWCFAFGESNWDLHRQLAEVGDDRIVLIDAIDCAERAAIGSLVAKYLVLYRQAKGVVVNGFVRDIPHLIRENWPVWCSGKTPIGCFNEPSVRPLDQQLIDRRRALFDGAIAVCDDTGVVVIPQDRLTEDFLHKLDWIEEQEDIWFDCIDRRKWNTFDTVCLKKYLDEDPA